MALEDYTTYSETDPNSRYTVTANKIDADGLTRNEAAHISDDKGVNHFGATFEHDVKATVRADDGGGSLGVFWAVANSVADFFTWNDTDEDALVGYFLFAAGSQRVRLYNSVTDEVDEHIPYVVNTSLYITIERTSTTAIEMRIYSDSGRTTLLDTLSIAIGSGTEYRYVFGANSFDSGANTAVSFDSEDLDLKESAFLPFSFAPELSGGLRHLSGGLS